MKNTFRHILPFLLLLLSFPAISQPYLLDWDHVQVAPQASKAVRTTDEIELAKPVAEPYRAPVQPARSRVMPTFTDITPVWGYRNRWLRPNVQDTYNVQLSASAYFNHDSQAYHFVDVVEVTTIRAGRETHEIVTNSAQNRNVSVALNNLQEGDAYRLKIFWVDGSYRVLESFVNAYTDTRPIVDEPDFLANPYW